MRNLEIGVLAPVLFSIFAVTSPGFALSEKETVAVQAAQSWLKLVDSANYAESWDEAASLFREKVSRTEWKRAISSARSPLGSLKSRQFQSAHYMTSVPGAPDGEYVVIQFRASFEKKQSAIETVTPMLDNAEWKVSGYYIR